MPLLFPGSSVKGLLVLCLHKCYIWENCGSWVISLKALSQWDCRILKSTTPQERTDELSWFLGDMDSRNKR